MDESIEEIADLKEEIAEIELEFAEEIFKLEENWTDIAREIIEVPITPYKKDIILDFFGIAWLPHYVFQVGDRLVEIPAFEMGD